MGNLMGALRYKEPSTVEECDSTWETDSESDQYPGGEQDSGLSESIAAPESGQCGEDRDGFPQFNDMAESSTKMKRSFYAAKDLYKYRHSYPNYKEPRLRNEYRNLRFYLNKIPLVPDGIYVEEILTKWKGDYDKLEHNHTYIQWSQHNYLRITRILKSLGELGFESYKLPLVHLLLEEALVQGTLANMRHSALEYFVYTLRKHSERRALLRFAQRHYQPPENFIWGPPKRRGSPGTRASRMESPLDRSVRITRALKQGSTNSPDEEIEGVDRREVGEWKTTKLSRSHQQGRGDTEEYIETVPL
ncbi:opioid growth factor receptor-like protein 1 isoform X2 [Pangasianodon hypophthalmus]|uniref:opioid growth factor receptor-like protein 1 isoform X2 n=1 Tax=Pangasianodon hypophthalmus TaxID=310915 RepID=UPI000EFE3161|nr:opioid growth factor receptor-like protein 1 isoform X2 [Pangasianodon hypophthalmus]